MNSGSKSNSQFPGFSSQAPMTPEQLAFLQTQQQAFVEFQQNFQNQHKNPPQFSMPQQQSQSSNSLSQTESQPKKGRLKRTAKKGKVAELIGDVTLRWTSNEETLLVKCFVAVSEDRNVGRSQPRDTLWFWDLNEFNRLNFQKRTKDMLLSKWSTLNHHCQKFNAIYKRCNRLKKSDENEVDLMKRARGIYQDENKNNSFNHEKTWAVLRKHAKWDAPDPAPADLTEDENVLDEYVFAVITDELFGPDARPRPPGKQRPRKKTKSDTSASTGGSNSPSQFGEFMSHELRLKREVAEKAFEVSKEKDRTITRSEELRFLALSMKDLSPDDAYWIELQKKQIKDKLRSQMPRDSNNNKDDNQTDDSDE
ncbi:hypothetical protein Tco_0409671 [Tanacetum coccineum]